MQSLTFGLYAGRLLKYLLCCYALYLLEFVGFIVLYFVFPLFSLYLGKSFLSFFFCFECVKHFLFSFLRILPKWKYRNIKKCFTTTGLNGVYKNIHELSLFIYYLKNQTKQNI